MAPRNHVEHAASKPVIDQIVEIVTDAAAEERERRGEDCLLGTCAVNSLRLAELLSRAGFHPETVWGWIETGTAEEPETVLDAYDRAVVHVWVEVAGVTAEMASEASGWVGSPAVFDGTPSEYHAIERHEYRDTEPRRRLADSYRAVTDR